jgi:hypothetical protein
MLAADAKLLVELHYQPLPSLKSLLVGDNDKPVKEAPINPPRTVDLLTASKDLLYSIAIPYLRHPHESTHCADKNLQEPC